LDITLLVTLVAEFVRKPCEKGHDWFRCGSFDFNDSNLEVIASKSKAAGRNIAFPLKRSRYILEAMLTVQFRPRNLNLIDGRASEQCP